MAPYRERRKLSVRKPVVSGKARREGKDGPPPPGHERAIEGDRLTKVEEGPGDGPLRLPLSRT